MLGPLPPLTGGMATVVCLLRDSGLRRRSRLVVLNNGKTTRHGRSVLSGAVAQLRLLGRLLAVLVAQRTQIVHIHTCAFFAFWRDGLHALLARLLGKRVVWHIHDGSFARWLEESSALRGFLLRRLLCLARLSIVLSSASAERLRRLAPGVPWRVVANGVPIPRPAAGER